MQNVFIMFEIQIYITFDVMTWYSPYFVLSTDYIYDNERSGGLSITSVCYVVHGPIKTIRPMDRENKISDQHETLGWELRQLFSFIWRQRLCLLALTSVPHRNLAWSCSQFSAHLRSIRVHLPYERLNYRWHILII